MPDNGHVVDLAKPPSQAVRGARRISRRDRLVRGARARRAGPRRRRRRDLQRGARARQQRRPARGRRGDARRARRARPPALLVGADRDGARPSGLLRRTTASWRLRRAPACASCRSSWTRRPGAAPRPRPAACARCTRRAIPPTWRPSPGPLARRYGPGGSFWTAHPELAPSPIRSWQVWNEPNIQAFWATGPDPAAYVRMLDAVGAAIRAVDPGAEIVAGGLPYAGNGLTPPAVHRRDVRGRRARHVRHDRRPPVRGRRRRRRRDPAPHARCSSTTSAIPSARSGRRSSAGRRAARR